MSLGIIIATSPRCGALLVPVPVEGNPQGKGFVWALAFPDGASEPHPGRRGNPAPGHPEAQADPCRSARQPIRISIQHSSGYAIGLRAMARRAGDGPGRDRSSRIFTPSRTAVRDRSIAARSEILSATLFGNGTFLFQNGARAAASPSGSRRNAPTNHALTNRLYCRMNEQVLPLRRLAGYYLSH